MGKRILVVDDEPALRASLERALRLDGSAVELPGDGEQALTARSERPYDAVVLDAAIAPSAIQRS